MVSFLYGMKINLKLALDWPFFTADIFSCRTIVGKAQVLLIASTMATFYLSVAVSHDNVTVHEHYQVK